MPVKKFPHAYRRTLPHIIWIGLITREIFKGDDNAAAAVAVAAAAAADLKPGVKPISVPFSRDA